MGIFEHFPYVNFHELNLDWLIAQVKQNKDKIENMEDDIYNIMLQWLNDGTIQNLVGDVLSNKIWFADSLNGIDFDINDGDMVITGGFNAAGDKGSGMYLCNLVDGLQVGNYKYKPIFAESSLSLGILADGVTDNTAQFIRALNWVNHIDFLNTDIVILSTNVQLKSNLTINGNGCTFASKIGSFSQGSNMVNGVSLENVTIKNIEFNRLSTASDYYAINITNSNNITITNCNFYNGIGYAVKLSKCQNVLVEYCYAYDIDGISGNPGGLFYQQGGKYLIYQHLRSSNILDHVVYIDGSVEISDFTISDITSEDHKQGSLTNGAVVAIYGNAHDFVVEKIKAINTKSGIILGERINRMPYKGIIKDSIFDSLWENGITAIGSTNTGTQACDMQIINNTILNSGQDAISVRYGQRYYIQNNNIRIASRYGIEMSEVAYCKISNNVIVQAAVGLAIGQNAKAQANWIWENITINCPYGLTIGFAQSINNFVSNNLYRGATTPETIIPGNYTNTIQWTLTQ